MGIDIFSNFPPPYELMFALNNERRSNSQEKLGHGLDPKRMANWACSFFVALKLR